MPDFAQDIAKALNLRATQVAAAIDLLDEGATIPLSALTAMKAPHADEEQLRQVKTCSRRAAPWRAPCPVIASIEKEGKMTPELLEKLQGCAEHQDRRRGPQRPYKPNGARAPRWPVRRDWQSLADMILTPGANPDYAQKMAQGFLNEQVETIEDALAGARDIAAETISDSAEVRAETRRKAMQFGTLTSEFIEDAKDEKSVYETYYEFTSQVSRMRPHQVLAVNRGETEKVLRVKVSVEEKDWKSSIVNYFRPDLRSPFARNWRRPSLTRPSACCCRPSNVTCAAN
jgi:uncharacterized protein